MAAGRVTEQQGNFGKELARSNSFEVRMIVRRRNFPKEEVTMDSWLCLLVLVLPLPDACPTSIA